MNLAVFDHSIVQELRALTERAAKRPAGRNPHPLDPYAEEILAAWNGDVTAREIAELFTRKLGTRITDERVRTFVRDTFGEKARSRAPRTTTTQSAPAPAAPRPRRRRGAQAPPNLEVLNGGAGADRQPDENPAPATGSDAPEPANNPTGRTDARFVPPDIPERPKHAGLDRQNRRA